MKETFPALFAHSLSRLHCWHIASPPSLFIVSLQNTCCYSLCSMILFHTHLPVFGRLPPWACSVCHALSSSFSHSFIASFFKCSCALAYLCRSLPALSRKYICLLGHTAAFASFLLCKGSQARALQVPFILHYSRTFFKIFWDKPQNICFALSVK